MTPEVLVLCYHAVSVGWTDPIAIEPAALEQQVGGLLRKGFSPATFREAVGYPLRPGRTLVVTFDDAFRSVFGLARPILERLGVPATVFVPTARGRDGAARSWPGIDHWLGTPWESELAGASWEELQELAGAGWEIGSHTRSHPHLTELDDEALAEELEGSRLDCERHMGTSCDTLAYPFGEVDDRVAEAARRAGYTAAATLSQPFPASGRDPMRWPRLGIYRADHAARLRVKTWLYRHSHRGWNLALSSRGRSRPER